MLLHSAGLWGVLGGAAVLAFSASAQAWELEAGARAVAASGVYGSSGEASPEGFVGRADLWGSATKAFDNGWRLGIGASGAVELDHPARDPRGGRAGVCPAGFADCAVLDGLPLRGTVSGFASDGPAPRREPRAAVEAFYVQLQTPWAEASLGRDQGAAARFSLAPPSILAATSLTDGALSLTGLGGPITVNDGSGSSTKLTVLSPRLLGLRLGVSFTPRLDARNLDQGEPGRGGAAYEAERILEAGASFARTWSTGVRTELGVAYLTADDRLGRSALERLATWSAGARLSGRGWRIGLAGLASDNGVSGDRTFSAIAASGVVERGPWSGMVEAGTARDRLVHIDVIGVQAAVRRQIGEGLGISGGLSWQERTAPRPGLFARDAQTSAAAGAFLEIAADL